MLKAYRAPLGLQVHKVLKEPKARRESSEPLERLDPLVQQAQQDQPALRVQRECKDLQERLGLQAHKATKVLRALKE